MFGLTQADRVNCDAANADVDIEEQTCDRDQGAMTFATPSERASSASALASGFQKAAQASLILPQDVTNEEDTLERLIY